MLARPKKLKLILTHEIFHFVWAHLGNRRRAEYSALIANELVARARGELGESAAEAKHGDLKNYICESFCDTGAWLYSGVKTSPEFTLARRWQNKRKMWFLAQFADRRELPSAGDFLLWQTKNYPPAKISNSPLLP